MEGGVVGSEGVVGVGGSRVGEWGRRCQRHPMGLCSGAGCPAGGKAHRTLARCRELLCCRLAAASAAPCRQRLAVGPLQRCQAAAAAAQPGHIPPAAPQDDPGHQQGTVLPRQQCKGGERKQQGTRDWLWVGVLDHSQGLWSLVLLLASGCRFLMAGRCSGGVLPMPMLTSCCLLPLPPVPWPRSFPPVRWPCSTL